MIDALDVDGVAAQDLVDLIVWLAIPYHDGESYREPIFATEAWTGSPLEEGERRQATWRAIFGECKEPAPGRWVQCGSCRRFHVAHPDSDRALTDHDVATLVRYLPR